MKNPLNKKKKNKNGYFTRSKILIKNLSLNEKKIIKKFFRNDNLKLQKEFKNEINLSHNGYV